MLITHVEPGKEMNKKAENLFLDLCAAADELGNFKGNFIGHPVTAKADIIKLENEWHVASVVVYRFAKFLNKSIYAKANLEYIDDGLDETLEVTVPPKDEDSWIVIKTVIDMFDRVIGKLPTF
ncbi:hypothetical protein CTheo_7405 [Ceratobasidium theobromae]|uniref:Uncharacterized protein n=1 Tax=Ceratobasidium theobromae TaxID=1582974 RepID=A0A5N5QCI2_9AGAM|nr:hypothetical protein CTheo_7405 [Ceratobasidium theobromae]